MLLSMDKNGNIYQAASHRPDGKGVERIPTLSGGGDVALENPYWKAEEKRQRQNKILEAHNAQEKIIEATQKRQMGAYIKAKKQKQARADALYSDSRNQKALIEAAVLQNLHGADFDMLSISGYSKTSDGRKGKSSQQRAYEAAILQGLGHTPQLGEQGLVHELDAYEKEQWELMVEAESLKNQNRETQILQAQPSESAVQPDATAASLPPLIAESSQPPITDTVKSVVKESSGLFADPKVKMAAALGVLFLVLRK